MRAMFQRVKPVSITINPIFWFVTWFHDFWYLLHHVVRKGKNKLCLQSDSLEPVIGGDGCPINWLSRDGDHSGRHHIWSKRLRGTPCSFFVFVSSKVKVNDSLMLFEHLLSHDYSTPSLFKGDAQSPNPSSKKIYPVLISIQLTVLFKKTAEYSSAHSPIKRMSNPSRPSPVPLGHSVLRSIQATCPCRTYSWCFRQENF